jgi:hypothetical protein
LFLAAVAGCKKSDPEAKSPTENQPSPDVGRTVALMHWLGKTRLAAESNATNFIAIWNLPESTKLEAQTLDKLSTAPWRLLSVAAPVSNAPAALLRPLLDDLVQEESYLEVQAATNHSGALVLALRLDAARAELWRTNLAAIVESLTGAKTAPAPDGWTLKADIIRGSTCNLGLTRAGDWTLVSYTFESNNLSRVNAQRPTLPPLLTDFTARIQRDRTPFVARTTNFWLEAEADLRALPDWLPLASDLRASLAALENLPRITMTLIGDGKNVRTRGELNFPATLAIPLESWQLPTNLVREPLISFGAVRGLRGILAPIKIPSWLGLSEWPDQFYSWGRSGPPLQIYAAFPTRTASNDFFALSHPMADWIRTHLPASDYGAVAFDTNSARLNWDGLHFGLPSLRVVTNANSDFLLLSLASFPLARTNQLPAPLIERITSESHLVALAWEFTGERLSQWRYFDDASRMTFDAARRPRLNPSAASIEWVANVMTNLEHSLTEVQLTGPTRLGFTRKSTVGLTGWEIDVLANWLELPQFPDGFQSLFATNPAPRVVRRKVNPISPPNSAP